MKLSKRLETIASFVPKGSKIADIGTDHGYIPIYLAERGWIEHALAMDVGKGPLQRAREHVEENGLSDKISLRLSDGLSKMESGEADTVIIAGMGGELVIHILEDGRRLWPEIDRWILSPHSEIDKVRRYLRREGFCIQRETMLKDEGKFYTVMEAAASDEKNLEEPRLIDDLYGAYLLKMKHPVLREYLKKEMKKTEELLLTIGGAETERARARVESLSRELELIKEAEHEMQ